MNEDVKITKKVMTEPELIKEVETLLENNKVDDAINLVNRMLEGGATSAAVYHLKGLTYSFSKEYDAAKEWILKAIEKRGNYWLYMKNLSVINRHMGLMDESYGNLVKALETKKNDYEIFRFLSEAKKFKERPAEMDEMEKIIATQVLKPKDKANLYFAIGKIYDDLKEYDKAFENYDKGNKATGHTFDNSSIEENTAKLIYTYSRSYITRAREKGLKGAKPVFVVGMPRSGTSLMEQLIASHPKGAGAGELSDINKISNMLDSAFKKHGGYPMALPRVVGDFRRGFGQSYLNNVQKLTGIDDPSVRIVDKQPLNFRRMGLIAELFPDGKIIHMKRDARDTCLSCYFQHFVSMQHYSFNLETLGRFYRMYERVMEHWAQVMPEHFITVEYENLVENFEDEARRVIDFLDLDWDDACLKPHRAKNLMQTASAWQVRQPVYTSSTARWKNYEKHLAPLIGALNAGIDV